MHFLFNAKQTQSAENTLCPYSEGKLDEYEISILVTLQISQRKTTMANQYKLILKKKNNLGKQSGEEISRWKVWHNTYCISSL